MSLEISGFLETVIAVGLVGVGAGQLVRLGQFILSHRRARATEEVGLHVNTSMTLPMLATGSTSYTLNAAPLPQPLGHVRSAGVGS